MKAHRKLSLGIFGLVMVIVVIGILSTRVSGRVITVDDDGEADYSNIQDAIDSSEDGDIIRVHEGVYFESINIDKSINIWGNGTGWTVIDGPGAGDVVKIESDWVNLSGFSVTDGGHGIRVQAKHATIYNVDCYDNNGAGILLYVARLNEILDVRSRGNRVGIALEYGEENTIVNCDFTNNGNTGIDLEYSIYNEFVWNTCTGNRFGVEMKHQSSYNTFDDNNCSGNDNNGFCVQASSEHNVFERNKVNFNDDDGFFSRDSDHNDFQGNEVFSNRDNGISLFNSNLNILEDNDCQFNKRGMLLRSSNELTIRLNTCSNNEEGGISLDKSNKHAIIGNILSRNGGSGLTLDVMDCAIYNNSISYNENGITVSDDRDGILLLSNSIYGNIEHGIYFWSEGSETLNATNNWWGTPTGPYHPAGNPNGQGDEVQDNVAFFPWLLNGPAVQLQTTRYVMANAFHGGNGTLERPFDSIQDAIDISRRGDTIRVLAGTYFESIHVDRKMQIIGDGSELTIIDGEERGDVVIIGADSVTFSGFHVKNGSKISGYAGIRLESDNNLIAHNICSNNRNGIYPKESNGNTIEYNVCHNNTLHGMTFGFSNSNTNVISHNIFSGNDKNGVYVGEAVYNTFLNNFFLSNSNYGIYIYYSMETNLENNTFSQNLYGIGLHTSRRFSFKNNVCSDNERTGIRLNSSSDNNFHNNIVSNNTDGFCFIDSSNSNTLDNNTITGNREYGVNATGNNFTVDASMNYWGNDNGPYHHEKNPLGMGDRISKNVGFEPWLTHIGEHQSIPESGDEESDVYLLALLVAMLLLLSFVLALVVMSVFVDRLPPSISDAFPFGKRFR